MVLFREKCLGCREPLDDHIRYQLMHRAASALLTAQQFNARIAVMLVQSFSPISKWRDDFDAFADSVAIRTLTPDLHELQATDNTRLLIGWCSGSAEFLKTELPNAV